MARFNSMVDLARTPEEVRDEISAGKPASLPKPTVPTYPWGLCVSLDEDTLEKLGLDGDLPDVGDLIQFTALARVTSASQNERTTETGEKEVCQRIELQITAMDVGGTQEEQDPSARRKRFYGDPEAEEGYSGDDEE